MTFRSNALLFYGVVFEENDSMPWDSRKDVSWIDILAENKGLKVPTALFKDSEKEWKEYWRKCDEILKELGVTVELFGQGNHLRYAFCIKDTLVVAEGSYAEVVKGEDLVVKKDWTAKLNSFAELLGVKIKDKPQYYLVAYGVENF